MDLFYFMEVWKQLEQQGLSNYEVSDLGRLRNKNTLQILKPSLTRKGYYNFRPSKKVSYQVHRLVAISFLGMKERMVVNHKNNIHSDNRLENLEWLSPKENMDHYYSKFHEHKVKRKSLTAARIKSIFESQNWSSAEEFHNKLQDSVINMYTALTQSGPE